MPFNLTADRQVLVIKDLSNETYELYYRMPTNAERVAYTNSLFVQKGKKRIPKENVFAERVALGKKLCLGFSENYFMDGDAFISSDKSKPYFRQDWKDLIEKALPNAFYQVSEAALNPARVDGVEEEEFASVDDEEAVGEGAPADDAQDQADPEAQAKADETPLGSNSEAS